MKKLFVALILILTVSLCKGQAFYFNVPNTQFQAEPGTGFDTRLFIGFTNPKHSKVILSAQTPQRIKAFFQPDTIYFNDTAVLSLIVTDSNLVGQTYTINLKAADSANEITRTVHLQVTKNWGPFPPYPAITYRDQAINYLNSQHPEIITTYGNMLSYNWASFWQFPPLIVVSNYVFLTNNWRCNVLWHIMIPPYDWKKIFIYNEQENVCYGVFIDTDGNFSEVPCEKHYYFYQDTNTMSIDEETTEISPLVYPNPCSDFVTIKFPNPENESKQLQIFDICGRLVQEVNNIKGGEVKLNDINWKSGIYFYRINDDANTSISGRIIKCVD